MVVTFSYQPAANLIKVEKCLKKVDPNWPFPPLCADTKSEPWQTCSSPTTCRVTLSKPGSWGISYRVFYRASLGIQKTPQRVRWPFIIDPYPPLKARILYVKKVNSATVKVKSDGVRDMGDGGIDPYSSFSFQRQGDGWTDWQGTDYYYYKNLPPEIQRFRVRHRDKVGNISEPSDWAEVNLSAQPPGKPAFNPDSSDWLAGALGISISFQSSPSAQLIRYCLTDYASGQCPIPKINSSNCTVKNKSCTVSLDMTGEWAVCAQAKNSGGWGEKSCSGPYKIDRAPPSQPGPPELAQVFDGQKFSLTATSQPVVDLHSGPHQLPYQFQLEGSEASSWLGEPTISFQELAEGTYRVRVRHRDSLDNITQWSSWQEIVIQPLVEPPGAAQFIPESLAWQADPIEVLIDFNAQGQPVDVVRHCWGGWDEQPCPIFELNASSCDLANKSCAATNDLTGEWRLCSKAKNMAGWGPVACSGPYRYDSRLPEIEIKPASGSKFKDSFSAIAIITPTSPIEGCRLWAEARADLTTSWRPSSRTIDIDCVRSKRVSIPFFMTVGTSSSACPYRRNDAATCRLVVEVTNVLDLTATAKSEYIILTNGG